MWRLCAAVAASVLATLMVSGSASADLGPSLMQQQFERDLLLIPHDYVSPPMTCPYGNPNSQFELIGFNAGTGEWLDTQTDCLECIYTINSGFKAGCSVLSQPLWYVHGFPPSTCDPEEPADPPARVAVMLNWCHQFQCRCEADGPAGQALQEP